MVQRKMGRGKGRKIRRKMWGGGQKRKEGTEGGLVEEEPIDWK